MLFHLLKSQQLARLLTLLLKQLLIISPKEYKLGRYNVLESTDVSISTLMSPIRMISE